MKRDNFKTAYIALTLLVLVILVGVSGFMILEHYTFTEAFFMTIITMATVGYKEIRELSPTGMWFTAFLIIFSFGIFAYVVSTFTKYLLDGVFRNIYKNTKVRNKIEKLEDHVVVCGYGRNGKQATQELFENNVQMVIIESKEELIAELQNNNDLLYIQGNATEDEVLKSANIATARALITTLPVDADNLFVVLTAREINPNITIISRASNDSSYNKLKRAGATNVIMPDKIGGQRMAKLVIQPDVVDFIEYVMLQGINSISLEKVNCEGLADCFEGKSVRELDSSNDSGANIIGLKLEDHTFVINPLTEVMLSSKDSLFVLGTKRQVKRLKDIIVHGK
jgi:voltage-gated potassium channel